ncbi:hypothetical protein [Pseudothioclava arenosa]|uniref:hypothetical protein n=1 Tax=Pseudothioclava arenosa TaxID=1795308 RepID=UPI00117EC81C|nr:hypothetical protein [Pseudothioclava arenosa]
MFYLLLLVSILLFALAGRTPWLDESMLLVNLRDIGWTDVGRPLPYYDQVAPPGQLALGLLIRDLFGFEAVYPGLKLVSLGAYLGLVLILAQSFRPEGRPEFPLVVLALILMAPLLMNQVTQAKHYMFDAFVSAAILASGYRLTQGPTVGRLSAFVAICLAGTLFSFVSIISAMGTLAAVFIYLALERERAGRKGALVRVALTGLGLAGYFLIYKRLLVDPTAIYQLTAYPEVYQKHLFAGGDLAVTGSEFLRLVLFSVSNRVLDTLASNGAPVFAFFLFNFAILLFLFMGFRRGGTLRFVALACGMTLLGTMVLNALGALPIPYERHFSFLQPFTLTLIALLVLRFLSRWPRFPRWAVVLLLVFGLDGILNGMFRPRGEDMVAMAYLTSDENEEGVLPVWISFASQPTFDFANWQGAPVHGVVGRESDYTSWTVRGGARDEEGEIRDDYPMRFVEDMRPYDRARMILSHHWGTKPLVFLETAFKHGWDCEEETEVGAIMIYLCEREGD